MKPFLWLTDGPRLKLATRLSLEDFAREFERSVDPAHFTMVPGFTGSTRFLGRLSGRTFKLEKRRFLGNHHGSFFHGQVRATDAGSEIDGYFRIHAISKAFAILLFSGWLIFAAALFLMAVASLLNGDLNSIWGIFIAFGAMVSVVGAAIFMKVIGRKEEAMFLKFFDEVFGASLVERSESLALPRDHSLIH